jgi:SAM-dependent methyltransferase
MNADWSGGYVADIGYTFGYYHELNPLQVQLAFLNAGITPPTVGAACELGFGQGLSVNMHAAASVTSWHGTDFNPSQAGFAQELAQVSGAESRLFDESFEEFSNRSDLPEFDYIGLHGIWSWISDANRKIIVEFIRRKLKVGGVLYISYNAMPGRADFAPMRHIMTLHADVMGSEGAGQARRIDDALAFADGMLAVNPRFAKNNPSIAERLAHAAKQDRSYLAHEYFNRDWHPMYFSEMAEWLAPAKVSFACSASYFDHIDALSLTPDQQAFLNGVQDPTMKQSVRDFMTNSGFRKDFWVKGPRPMAPFARTDAIRDLRVVLTVTRSDVPEKVKTATGEAGLTPAIYGPILDVLADQAPHTLKDIEERVRHQGVTLANVLQCTVVLCGMGSLALAQDEQTTRSAKPHTDRLNAHLIRRSRDLGDISHLCSPVTGGGVVVPRFDQMFLLARSEGLQSPAEWAGFVWSLLAQIGQKLRVKELVLETEEENRAELTRQAETFAEKSIPVLKALQVI